MCVDDPGSKFSDPGILWVFHKRKRQREGKRIYENNGILQSLDLWVSQNGQYQFYFMSLTLRGNTFRTPDVPE